MLEPCILSHGCHVGWINKYAVVYFVIIQHGGRIHVHFLENLTGNTANHVSTHNPSNSRGILRSSLLNLAMCLMTGHNRGIWWLCLNNCTVHNPLFLIEYILLYRQMFRYFVNISRRVSEWIYIIAILKWWQKETACLQSRGDFQRKYPLDFNVKLPHLDTKESVTNPLDPLQLNRKRSYLRKYSHMWTLVSTTPF